MDYHINYLTVRAAEERSAAFKASDVQASRIHVLAAECYEAQAHVLAQQQFRSETKSMAA